MTSSAAPGAERLASARRGSIPGLSTAAPRVSLGEVVAERVRQAILNDDLKPGQHLREEEISEMLQVSRGPVRDAFLLLEREGLVRLSRHRGASVVELSAEDLGEVYSLRSAVEELGVRLAIRRHTDADLATLDQSMVDLRNGLKRKLSEQEAARLDVEFHDAIFAAAHHERLYATWSSLRMQVYWFLLQRNIASADWRTATVAGHQTILDLVRSGDEDAAAASVHQHIAFAYQRIVEQMSATEDESARQSAAEQSAAEVAKSFFLA